MIYIIHVICIVYWNSKVGKSFCWWSFRVLTCPLAFRTEHRGTRAWWLLVVISCSYLPYLPCVPYSASGYACLVAALAYLHEIKGDISMIARQVLLLLYDMSVCACLLGKNH